MSTVVRLALVLVLGSACSASQTSDRAATRPAEPALGPNTAASAPAGEPDRTASQSAGTADAAVSPEGCGALGCRLYDSPEQAFASVLERQPLILAVGEAHAQKGSEKIASATRRFSESLLPQLRDKASDLVLELWLPDPRCLKQVKKVEARQKPVTEAQAEGTQSEYVGFGKHSEALGIRPHALRPTCEQYDQIVAAGAGDLDLMLTLIARQTAAQTKALLARNRDLGSSKLLVLYGGAMHNDLEPRKGREAWSFGPELYALTQGRYLELDLIVPEFIKDNESWRALPWYAHFDPEKQPTKTTLFNPRPGSYTLIFPRTANAGAP